MGQPEYREALVWRRCLRPRCRGVLRILSVEYVPYTQAVQRQYFQQRGFSSRLHVEGEGDFFSFLSR